jgi:hypothetical protein
MEDASVADNAGVSREEKIKYAEKSYGLLNAFRTSNVPTVIMASDYVRSCLTKLLKIMRAHRIVSAKLR